MNPPTMRLFTFAPAWGLPTAGPFGLKLEMCLRMLGVPYECVYENDNRKGPSAFGLLAVSIRSPLMTPVCSYARSKPNLVAFVDRALARFFPEHVAAEKQPTAA
jgi:hypothetical protein